MHSFTPKNRQKFAGPKMPVDELLESPADEAAESPEMQASEAAAGMEAHAADGSMSSDGMEAVKQMIGSLSPDQLQMLNEYTSQLLAANNQSDQLDLDKMMNEDDATSEAEDSSATVNGQKL